MTVHAKIGEKIEHLLDFLHGGFFINSGIGRDLITEELRHFDGENAFLEHALALDDQVMRPLESVEMHIPIHPFARPDRRFSRIFWPFANVAGIFFTQQTSRE